MLDYHNVIAITCIYYVFYSSFIFIYDEYVGDLKCSNILYAKWILPITVTYDTCLYR